MVKILLEAEPVLLGYMSNTERLAMQRLETIAGCEKVATYAEPMDIMLSTTNAHEIFYKDYRQTSYGFAVIKCKEPMEIRHIAEVNNTKHHLPLIVVKEIVYSQDFSSIISKTIALVTNPSFHDKSFKACLLKTVATACRIFHGQAPEIEGDLITMKNNPKQTPRLLLMPLIGSIVKEHMKFRYSCTIGRYISMRFYSGGNEPYGQPGEECIVKTGLSFLEVKALLKDKHKTSFLTLPEFWKVYHEMQARKDISALKSLESNHYIELLDTLIKNPNTLIHGSSPPQELFIQAARPALINPLDGDEVTGLPTILQSPDKYNDKTL